MAGSLPFDVQGARDAGYTDDQIVQELSKSGKVPYDFNGALKAGHSASDILNEVSPQPSGYLDNLKQGFGEAVEGVGNTLDKAGLTNVGPAVENYGKSWEPKNFVPTPIFDDKGNFNGVSAIGKNLARATPLGAASIAAAGLAPEAAPAAAVVGLGALPGFLSSAGNEIDATGSVPRGLATAAGENLVTATPVGRFLGGAAPAAGKVGLAGVAGALKRLGVTAAEQGVASGAGAAVGDIGRSGTVNPTDVKNAALGGAAGGALFAGARKTLPEVLNAVKYSAGGNDPLDAQARAQVANRIVANAGGDADALQGGLLPSGKQARLGADAVNKTRADIKSELSDAVKNLSVSPDVDTQNALNAAQGGQHLTDAGYDLITKGLGNDPQAANILNLIRQNEQLDLVGGHEVGGKLIGGLSSLPRHLVSGEHIAKSGLVGLMALAGEHAGHVIAFSPATIGAAGGAMLGGRLLDNLTGAQTPAGRFVRNFADGGDVRLPPVTPPQTPTAQAAPVGPTGPRIAQPPQPWANPPQPPVVPPVAGGRIIPPQVQQYMAGLQAAAKANAKNAPAPAAPATIPQVPKVLPSEWLNAQRAKFEAANAPAPEAPALDPNRLPTNITAPARSIMRGAAAAEKMRDATNPVQIREATDLMAARRANAKLNDEAQEVPAPAPAPVTPVASAPAPAPAKVTGSLGWTPERVARMNELLAKGVSTSKVADELGVTKNAVIGKSNRMRQAAAKAAPPPAAPAPPAPAPVEAPAPAPKPARAPRKSALAKLSPQARGEDDLSIPPFLQRTAPAAPPKPTKVSKAQAQVQTKVEAPGEEDYAIPRSAFAHLSNKEAAEKEFDIKVAQGRYIKNKSAYINGAAYKKSLIDTQAAKVAAAAPGIPEFEIAAQFKGVKTREGAVAHREWLKRQYPQAAPALDKYFSDAWIGEKGKEGQWPK